MNFRTSILLFGAFSLVATLLTGAAGFYGVTRLQGVLMNNVGSAKVLRDQMQADMMHDALRADVLNATLAARSREKSALDQVDKDLAEHLKIFKDAIASNEAAALPDEIRKALDAVKPDLKIYEDRAHAAIDAARRSEKEVNQQLPQFLDSFAKLETSMGQLGDLIEEHQKTDVDVAEIRGNEIIQLLSVTLTAVVVAVALAVAVILRKLFAMLGGEPAYAARIAGRIAEGHLDDEIHEKVKRPGSVLATMKRMQTSLRERIESERRIAEENLRIRNALDKASTNMMLVNPEGIIVYCNDGLLNLMRQAQAALRESRPDFSAEAVQNGNIELVLHDASLRQQLMGASSPQTTQLRAGEFVFRLSASPVVGAEGKRIGTTLEWLDRSAETHAEEELDAILSQAVRGDFSQRLRADDKTGFFRDNAVRLNNLLDVVSSGLRDVAGVLNAMASGDLTESIKTDYEGVFGELKDATNTTVARLRELLAQIQEATEQVTRASQEIATGNSDLSSRTEEQASNLEETSATMEELNATVKKNSEYADKATELARNSNAVANRGGEVVQRVVGTMSAIQDASKKIADIIGIIDSIAFQTNILALNAAVEAARAGDQGRGFAVVATEVRGLAQRSSAAAQEIKNLIAASVSRVDEGAELVQEAGRTMKEVVSSFQGVAQLVSDISHASHEQAAGIDQVSITVGHLDETTQQNSALVEEAAAAADSLAEQARQLDAVVSTFKLR